MFSGNSMAFQAILGCYGSAKGVAFPAMHYDYNKYTKARKISWLLCIYCFKHE